MKKYFSRNFRQKFADKAHKKGQAPLCPLTSFLTVFCQKTDENIAVFKKKA